MNRKGMFSSMWTSVLVLFLILGGSGAWYVWSRLSRFEQRGIALELKVVPSPEQRKLMEERYNELLDEEKLLLPLIEDLDLVGFYGVKSEQEALEEMRERSELYFKTEKSLWVVHRAKRWQRKKNDEIGKNLGASFVENAFPKPPSEQ